jgi:hypothetical protein
MERLWSLAGATGRKWECLENGSNKPIGNRSQPHGNGFGAHGKEGVDGSSPSEGFEELPANHSVGLSCLTTTVKRGQPRARADVPSLSASAGRVRLLQADSNRSDPSVPR